MHRNDWSVLDIEGWVFIRKSVSVGSDVDKAISFSECDFFVVCGSRGPRFNVGGGFVEIVTPVLVRS
jgi:hypothetical protein